MDTNTPRESAPPPITGAELLDMVAGWIERETRVYGRSSEGSGLHYLMGIMEREQPEKVARLQRAICEAKSVERARSAAR
jgi:hypothetical protein